VEPGDVNADDRDGAAPAHNDLRSESAEPSSEKTLGRLRTAILLAILLAGVALAIRPTYSWWHARQSRFYDEACEHAAEQESWEQLEAIARQWVEWDPEASRGWVHLSDALLKQSKPEAAVEAMARVSDSYPDVLDVLAIRGDILFSDLSQPYAALENWERMLQINETATVARQRMIYFYAMTLQRERMREQVLRAMELGGEPPEAYTYLFLAYDVNFSDGLLMARRWLESYPDDETLQVAAAIYLATFRSRNPLSIMESNPTVAGDLSEVYRLREVYPENIELLAVLLDKAVFEGDTTAVLDLLMEAPEGADQDPRFWRYRGWYLDLQDRHEDAAQALLRCVELNPFDWRARILLGSVLRQLGRSEAAEREARLGVIGKELHQELLELSNARLLDEDLASRIHDYSVETGPESFQRALADRLGQFE
jgi:tetratricopeptide (TPR) repeat protein